MFKYLADDLLKALRWLPFGIIFALLSGLFIRLSKKHGRFENTTVSDGVFLVLFAAYTAVVVCITFLSRESGSRSGLDMRLFSTWGINKRNNAYVIENILLFLPLGFLAPKVKKIYRNIFYCTLNGFLFSVLIETLQLVTKRGYFQIDDILTNTLGMFLGCLLFWAAKSVCKTLKNQGIR